MKNTIPIVKLFSTLLLSVLFLCHALYSQEKPENPQQPPAAGQGDKAAAEKNAKKSDAYTIGEIVVRDTAISVIEDAGTSSTITDRDIRVHSDKTLDDSLRMVPGIQVETHRKGYVRARLRGLDQDKLAILVDGIPVIDVYSTDIDISSIPVVNIERIIISRGAASALYGTKGAIGVINIITRRPRDVFAEASFEYGQYNNITVNFAQGAPLGKFYYWISGSIIKSESYEVSATLDRKERKKWFERFVRYGLYPNPANSNLPYTYNEVSIPAKDDYVEDTGLWDHNNFEHYTVSGKFYYEFSDDRELGLTVQYSYKTGKTNTFQANCISNYKDDTAEWEDPLFQLSSNDDIQNAAFRNRSFVWPAIHNLTISPYTVLKFNKFMVRTNLFFSYRSAEQEGYASTDHSYVKDAALAGTVYEPFREIKTYMSYGLNCYPSYTFGEWNKLTAAVLINNNTYLEENQAVSAEKSPVIAATLFGTAPFPVQELSALYFSLALEDEMTFLKILRLTLGISYDMQYFYTFKNREALYQYDDAYIVKEDSALMGTKDSFNPVAGLVIDAVPDLLRFRVSGSMKTRFPNLSEYSKIVDDRRDNRLKPERSYNAGAGFEIFLFDKKLDFRADYFFSMVEDRIVTISGGIDTPVNIDSVVSQGLETILTYTHKNIGPVREMSVQVSYTYLNARNHDNTPEEKVNKGAFLEFTPVHQVALDFHVDFISGTGLALWGYSTINQVAYTMRSRPEPFPAAVPFSTGYFEAVRLHDPVMLNIKVSQTFLTHYQVYVMCKNLLDDYNADPFIPGPGRMFFGGVSARF